MEAVSDVMNLDVNQVQQVKLTNVLHMEAVSDVMNLDVKQVPETKLINV
jgi:predicted XRE-type DNA-binding protein